MPILDVEITVEEGEALPRTLAGRIADAAAAVLGAGPGRVWVKLRALAMDQYAESGGGPATGVRPVFVTVLKARSGTWEERNRECAALTAAIAGVLDRPAENVHVAYAEPAAGRQAFGGRLLDP